MTAVRRVIAAVAVIGTLAVVPISMIAEQSQSAGQGTWPFSYGKLKV
jgi:hypothetical protein